MGARPSAFKKGGGFLKGVDGVIENYEFTDAFNGVAWTPGKNAQGKEKFHSLYCVLTVRVDGADEPVTTTLFVGGADDFEITDDGHTLVPNEEGRELGGGTSFAKLITSLVEAGFPETNLSEDTINYEPIIGVRCRFDQVVNVEDTKKLGKRKSKDGTKEYDRQDLVIKDVYELPKASKSAAKAAPKAKGKAAKDAEAEELDALATDVLLSILSENDGQIAKAKVSTKVLMHPTLKGNPLKEAVRKRIFDEAFLTLPDRGFEYSAKNQMISLAA